MAKQACARSQKYAPTYKFGIQIPRNWCDARKLQEVSNHTKWTDAEKIEMDQVNDYKAFKNLGKNG